MWTIKTTLLFICASCMGAFLRFAIMESLHLFQSENILLWGVFMVNMLGCFLFGTFWILVEKKAWNARIMLIAFLGSLTTFSSYIYDMYIYLVTQNYALLFGNTFLQIALGVVLMRLGIFIANTFLNFKISSGLR